VSILLIFVNGRITVSYRVYAVLQFLQLRGEQLERVVLAVLPGKGRGTGGMESTDPVFKVNLSGGLKQSKHIQEIVQETYVL
jgi:hypothetical protein